MGEKIKAYANQLADKSRLTPVVQEAIDQAIEVKSQYDLVYYVAGALTGMNEAVKKRYERVVQLADGIFTGFVKSYAYAPHINGTDPVKHPDVSPAEVRDIDYLWAVKTPTAHVNFWSPLAHGNAIEAGWAEEHGIPSIHMVEAGQTLSRLVRGMNNIGLVIEYQDFDVDGVAQLDAELRFRQVELEWDNH